MPENFDPYSKMLDLSSITRGLKFYYQLLDSIDIGIYAEDNFPISRGEVLATVMLLEAVPEDHKLNQLVHSHPTLIEAIDSIEFYENLESKKDLERLKYTVIIWLEHLLFTGCYILYQGLQIDYHEYSQNKDSKQILIYLYELKALYQKNTASYSRRLVKLVMEFLDIEIEKLKNIQSVESTNIISQEVNELIKSYLTQVNTNIENNDLFTPLRDKNFEQFIFKLKRLLYIPSYYDISQKDREKAFHIYLLGIVGGRLDQYLIKSNKESGLGRYDICLFPIDKRNPGVIIEIKKVDNQQNQESISNEVKQAFIQISEKHYAFDLKEEGIKTILMIAIVFDGLNPNLEWKLEENE